MNELLKLMKRLLKQGFAPSAEKQKVATMLKALDGEEQEVLQEDAQAVEALPEEAPASDDDAQAEVEKGIKTLVKSAIGAATDDMKSEMKAWLEEQKSALEKKSGIYHPEVQEKRKRVNDYIRKFAAAVLDNDMATVKELSTDTQGSPFGGYVVDSELSAEIRHLVTEYGVARREMSAIQLSKNSYRANELVTDVSVAWVDEGAVIPSKEIVLDQESLSLKKLGAIVAITRELLEDQEVDLFAFIGNRVAEKFAQAEDLMAFVGDGTSTTAVSPASSTMPA
jgi:HK97 family phage major capsid protein